MTLKPWLPWIDKDSWAEKVPQKRDACGKGKFLKGTKNNEACKKGEEMDC